MNIKVATSTVYTNKARLITGVAVKKSSSNNKIGDFLRTASYTLKLRGPFPVNESPLGNGMSRLVS